VNESRPGDLAFFDNEEGRITHVGIVLDENRIIHASGCVRIDTLDHEGIYNAGLKKYTHRLRIVKRYF
jgi:cell wall-associated NlpC family hydrolase